MNVVDSHHHFWRYTQGEFGWLPSDVLKRDFGPGDLRPAMDEAGVSGVISVQARQSIAETDQLLQYCASTPWILGVVGWLPLASSKIETMLENFVSQDNRKQANGGKRCLVGLRHVVEDETDPAFLNRPDFNSGVSVLSAYDLSYDILVKSHQLRQTVDFVARHPRQTFVIDHCAKPDIRNRERQSWEAPIRELARNPSVYCKISGLVREANERWTTDDLRYYVDVVLDAFGANRVMFGSDWPVCLARIGYKQWKETAETLLTELNIEERCRVMGKNALSVYKIKPQTAKV